MDRLDPEQFRRVDDDLSGDETRRQEHAVGILLSNLADIDHSAGPHEQVAHVVNRINEIAEENERLRERVSELEARSNPHPESKDYHDLSRDEKVQQLRESLVEKASTRHNGLFAMEYKDVMWLFDGHPSAGHCYQLMELAGEADGFSYVDHDEKSNQIRVNIDGVNDETLFHAVNKAPEEVRL